MLRNREASGLNLRDLVTIASPTEAHHAIADDGSRVHDRAQTGMFEFRALADPGCGRQIDGEQHTIGQREEERQQRYVMFV